MEISFKALAVTHAIVALSAGLLVHKYQQPVTIEHETIKDKIVEHVVEHKNPDGSTDTTTDRTETKKEKRTESVLPQLAQWRITGGVGTDLQAERQYKLGIERRILGPVWLGAYAASRGEAGVTLGVEF